MYIFFSVWVCVFILLMCLEVVFVFGVIVINEFFILFICYVVVLVWEKGLVGIGSIG